METRLHHRHPLVQFIFDNWIYIVVAILMWRLPHLLGDYFDQDIRPRRPQGNQPLYWMGVFIQLYIFVILAMSYNLIFGFAGILSFGHALFFGIGVYTIVIFMTDYAKSVEISAVIALGFAAIYGLITSLAVFRIKGVYFAMFTLALAQTFHDLARVNLFKFLTAGDDGRTISNLPDWINPVSNRLTFYYITALLVVLVYLFIRRLMNSPTGSVILAIRDNEQRAQTMGYNTALYKALVIVIASMLGTVAGILQAIFTRQAEPSSLALTRTIDPLFMTIIGGTGTHPGPVIGGVILQLGEAFFRKPDLQVDLNFILFHVRGTVNTTEIWRQILGVMFVLIVLLIPHGVVGQLNMLWIQIRRWLRKFVYDPILRARPGLASQMQPLTGEPSEVALALANLSKDESLAIWAKQYPWAAAYSFIFLVALFGAIVTWNIQTFFSLVLFLSLIATPIVGSLWLARKYGWSFGTFNSLTSIQSDKHIL